MKFICVYQNHWGRGDTAEEARKVARKAGGRGTAWVIFRLPEGAIDPWVDDFGTVRWTWPKGWTKEQLKEANLNTMTEVARGRGAK